MGQDPKGRKQLPDPLYHLQSLINCYLPFGWNILDKNLTVGGLFGYSSENSITSLKVPR